MLANAASCRFMHDSIAAKNSRTPYPFVVKYAIVILSGAADEPIAALGDRTPLEVASMPETARLASMGRVGMVTTTPEGWRPTSEVSLATLFGIDPTVHAIERGPIEAVGLGLERASATTCRVDLISIGSEDDDDAGMVRDHTGGGLTTVEADVLFNDLLAAWKTRFGTRVEGISISPARDHRSLLFDESDRAYSGVVSCPPRFMIGESAEDHLPAGGDVAVSGLLRELVEFSYDFLDAHEVNLVRRDNDALAANLAWIWGPGRTPDVQHFQEQFGMTGLVLSSDEVGRGLARAIGVDCLADSAWNDLASLGRRAVEALDDVDCVFVHVQEPDAAGHANDDEMKVGVLENIDRAIIGPLRERLEQCGSQETDSEQEGWRMMVAVDHATHSSTGEHGADPVPFVMAGDWIRAAVQRKLTERDARESDVQIDPGHELLEYFLRSGLARTRPRSRHLA